MVAAILLATEVEVVAQAQRSSHRSLGNGLPGFAVGEAQRELLLRLQRMSGALQKAASDPRVTEGLDPASRRSLEDALKTLQQQSGQTPDSFPPGRQQDGGTQNPDAFRQPRGNDSAARTPKPTPGSRGQRQPSQSSRNQNSGQGERTPFGQRSDRSEQARNTGEPKPGSTTRPPGTDSNRSLLDWLQKQAGVSTDDDETESGRSRSGRPNNSGTTFPSAPVRSSAGRNGEGPDASGPGDGVARNGDGRQSSPSGTTSQNSVPGQTGADSSFDNGKFPRPGRLNGQSGRSSQQEAGASTESSESQGTQLEFPGGSRNGTSSRNGDRSRASDNEDASSESSRTLLDRLMRSFGGGDDSSESSQQSSVASSGSQGATSRSESGAPSSTGLGSERGNETGRSQSTGGGSESGEQPRAGQRTPGTPRLSTGPQPNPTDTADNEPNDPFGLLNWFRGDSDDSQESREDAESSRRPSGGSMADSRRTEAENGANGRDERVTERLDEIRDSSRSFQQKLAEIAQVARAETRLNSDQPGEGNSGSSTAGSLQSAFVDALADATKGLAEQLQDFSTEDRFTRSDRWNRRERRSQRRDPFERFGSFGERANSWFVGMAEPASRSGSDRNLSVRGIGFGGGDFPTDRFLLAAILIAGAGWYFYSRKNAASRNAIIGGGSQTLPRTLQTRHDVVQAFHDLAARCPAVAADWWTHERAAIALATSTPEADADVRLLAELYEQARYLPEDASLSDEQLAVAKAAWLRCRKS